MRLRDALAIFVLSLPASAANAEFCALNITSDPPGAEVFINGKAAGKTPYVHQAGHPVRLRVKIVKKGFRAWEKDVEIGMNMVSGLDVVLLPGKRR